MFVKIRFCSHHICHDIFLIAYFYYDIIVLYHFWCASETQTADLDTIIHPSAGLSAPRPLAGSVCSSEASHTPHAIISPLLMKSSNVAAHLNVTWGGQRGMAGEPGDPGPLLRFVWSGFLLVPYVVRLFLWDKEGKWNDVTSAAWKTTWKMINRRPPPASVHHFSRRAGRTVSQLTAPSAHCKLSEINTTFPDLTECSVKWASIPISASMHNRTNDCTAYGWYH